MLRRLLEILTGRDPWTHKVRIINNDPYFEEVNRFD